MAPIDLSKLREDRAKLAEPARTPEPGIQTAQPGDVAAARRAALQDQRGALNADAFPPGQEPEADPIDKAHIAGRTAGPRGSDQAVGAYFEQVIEAAHQRDPRASHEGVMDSETRDRWLADSRTRQMANRDQSGAAHR